MFILMERVDYEGSRLLGAFATLEAALRWLAEEHLDTLLTHSLQPKAMHARSPMGATALWCMRSPFDYQSDVTFDIWAVSV